MTVNIAHSLGRVKAYVRMLERCDAPQALIEDFLRLVEIDNQIAAEPNGSLESLDRLLLDACRKIGFTKPFDSKQGKAYFRPNQLPDENPDSCGDLYGWGDEFNPKQEQAYRRGFSQGFADAIWHLENKGAVSLKARDAAITKWRFASVWYGATRPGTVEPFGLKVSIRSTIPTKIRWQVLERDQRRCVACGASAAQGVTLHIDHIVSIYNGGTNDPENLQTLCELCNLGKGKD